MPTARKLIVDAENPGCDHCISRCVRRAFLCGDGFEHRRAWIYRLLRLLDEIFALEVAGFAVMANRLHVIAVIEPDAPLEGPVARRANAEAGVTGAFWADRLCLPHPQV